MPATTTRGCASPRKLRRGDSEGQGRLQGSATSVGGLTGFALSQPLGNLGTQQGLRLLALSNVEVGSG